MPCHPEAPRILRGRRISTKWASRSKPREGKNLQQRFAGVPRNRFASLVTQPHNLLQLIRVAIRHLLWINRRRKGNGHLGWPRQKCSISQKPSRPCEGHRNHRRTRGHRTAERPQLERPHSVLRRKRPFREHKNRFALFQIFFHL